MNNQNPAKRPVKFKTKWELFKLTPIRLFLGIYLVIFTSFFFVISFTLTRSFKDKSVPDLDYDQISKEGKTTTGFITEIRPNYNYTINGQNPSIISYEFLINGEKIKSSYQIFEPDRVAEMKIGNEIEVKHIDTKSIISGIEPYEFPAELFFLIPLPFFIIGLILIISIYLKANKTILLYMYGQVKDAELISILPVSSFFPINFSQRIRIRYKYSFNQNEIYFGETQITDFSIVNEKRPGDSIKIFVSTDKLSVSTLIPKLESIRNNWGIQGLDK